MEGGREKERSEGGKKKEGRAHAHHLSHDSHMIKHMII